MDSLKISPLVDSSSSYLPNRIGLTFFIIHYPNSLYSYNSMTYHVIDSNDKEEKENNDKKEDDDDYNSCSNHK